MILGIDLGTCNTLAATLTRDGHPIIINDVSGKETSTPSLILIEEKRALVGSMAEQYMDLHPNKNFIRFFKRYFGTQEPVFFDNDGNKWFSESLAALMLQKVRFDAEMSTSEPATSVVITVPAHYNDTQRKSVLEAAKLANLNLTAIVEEPVAAALSYLNTSSTKDEIFMVYDFGGGTFDLTLLTSNGSHVHVLAKDGLSSLGGKEFDEIIASRILEEYKRCFGTDINHDVRSINRLRQVSESIKVGLCSSSTGYFHKWISLSNNIFEFNISLKEFQNKSAEFIQNTQMVVDRCLRSVGVSFSDINKIIMVGGTSHIPFIKTYWTERLDHSKQQLIYHHPFSSVALGAAIYAGKLSENSGIKLPLELTSVSTYNIAICIKDQMDVLIFKNSPLPIKAKRIYKVSPKDSLRLPLIQYWDEKEIFRLGTILISPNLSSDNINVELAVENRSNGTIGVKVKNAETGSDVGFEFQKEQSKHEYNSIEQKALVDNLIVNNIY